VGGGCAEEGQDAVAGEILDRAAELLDRVHHPAHGLADHQARLLRIEFLGDRRRPHEVGREGCDDSPFLAH
jgi:hypothetical protein